MLPNFLKIWGIAKNLGLKMNIFHLDEDNGWHVNLDELQQALKPGGILSVTEVIFDPHFQRQ